MTRTRRAAVVLLLTAGLVTGITACSPTAATAVTTETTADPTPTVNSAPVVETRAYTMADGTTVDVDPTQPLPPAVLTDIAAPSQAANAAQGSAVASGDVLAMYAGDTAAANAASKASALAAQQTGRQVIVIYRGWGTGTVTDDSAPLQWLWTASRGHSGFAVPDKATVVADVNAYIAASANPSEYDLIVVD